MRTGLIKVSVEIRIQSAQERADCEDETDQVTTDAVGIDAKVLNSRCIPVSVYMPQGQRAGAIYLCAPRRFPASGKAAF